MYFVMSTVSVGSFQKQVPLHVDCGSCYGLMLSAALAVLSMNSLEKYMLLTKFCQRLDQLIIYSHIFT